MAGRFLFYHTGGIGDFITILPVVHHLRNQYPKKEFVLLGRPAIGALGFRRFYFDRIEDIDGQYWGSLFSEGEPSPEARKVLKGVERAWLWSDSQRLLGHFSALGIPFHAHPPFPSRAMPIVQYHLEILSGKYPVTGAPAPRLYPNEEDQKAARTLMPAGHCVAIHPGSGSAKKNWPIEKFLSLADRLAAKRCKVLWILGPAESEGNFPKPSTKKAHVVASPPLPVLAAILSGCRLFIGNDSGIAHMAAAVDAPTVCLFGPSDVTTWVPRGKSVRVLCGRHQNVESISIKEVRQAIRAWVPV